MCGERASKQCGEASGMEKLAAQLLVQPDSR